MSGKRARRERGKVRDDVRGWCERIVGSLRRLLKVRAPAYYAAQPDAPRPCHTCAFNPATDTHRGFDATIMAFSEAVVRDQTFYCHDNLPKDPVAGWLFDPRTAVPCAGWLIVKDGPEAARAVVRGFMEQADLPDAVADRIAPFFTETFPMTRMPCLAPGVTDEDVRRWQATHHPRRTGR